MCLEIYKLDPALFLTVPYLVWKAALKKAKVKLYILTDVNMLLMVEKGIRGETGSSIHRFAKANNKYMKGYGRNKESSYFKYWEVNDLYGWAMSQKLLVNDIKWVKHISKFDEDFIKSYNNKSDEEYFLEVDVQYPENLYNHHSDLSFLSERMKIKKVEKLVANLHDKEECYTHKKPKKSIKLWIKFAKSSQNH